jgi:2-hydroxychromene-2-carboxylate isomerase
VPFAFPPIMPIAALAAARAVYWLREEGDPPLANRLAKALCRAHFGEGRDIQAPGQVAEVAAPLGIDGEALRAGIGRRSVKDRLRAETEESLARGVFGAPFVFVDGEPFWGADRLDQVEAWLARGGF